MVSLLILKHLHNLSDESVVDRWVENPYFQYFSGETHFQWSMPCDPSDLVHFRQPGWQRRHWKDFPFIGRAAREGCPAEMCFDRHHCSGKEHHVSNRSETGCSHYCQEPEDRRKTGHSLATPNRITEWQETTWKDLLGTKLMPWWLLLRLTSAGGCGKLNFCPIFWPIGFLNTCSQPFEPGLMLEKGAWHYSEWSVIDIFLTF